MEEIENHFIGQWLEYEHNELVTFKDLKRKVNKNNSTYEYAMKNYGEEFTKGLIKKINIKDYFDNRKNMNLIKFNYCPYCGEKIDWKELKSRC